jgi:hypothetical protein
MLLCLGGLDGAGRTTERLRLVAGFVGHVGDGSDLFVHVEPAS